MKRLSTLARLRIAWLLFGMMFFYGIEQLFLDKVIGNPSARAYLTIAYIVSLVVFDVPTGIMADKVSRKLSMLGACVIQVAALLVLGSSHTIAQYAVGGILFGLYTCMINGAAQALLYDWLHQAGRAQNYAKEQGRNYACFLLGAGIANVASGFLANAIGLQGTYFLSVIPAILALVVVYGIVEPKVHNKQAEVWFTQIRAITKNLVRNKTLLLYSLHLIVSGVLLYTIGEFGQIYILHFGIGTTALGIIWAVDALFAAGGRALAHRAHEKTSQFMLGYGLFMIVFSLVTNVFGIVLFWIFYGLNEALSNIAETEIQHQIPSNVRATTLSLVSLLGNIVAIPLLLIYNRFYLVYGILGANKLALLIAASLLLSSLIVRQQKNGNNEEVPVSPRLAI